MVNFTNIPAELKASCRFTVWKKETDKEGRLTKLPYNPATGGRAQSNNPTTFSEFPQAAMAYAMGGYEGIGIRVSDGIGAFDIDHCIKDDGTLTETATGILDAFPGCYVERSPSGKGLRGFFRVADDYTYDKTRYYINNQKLGLEVYIPGATHRFVTVTGDVYREGSLSQDMEVEHADSLSRLLDTYMKRQTREKASIITPHSYLTDDEVFARIEKSPQKEKFQKLYAGEWGGLYGSRSDADMALLSILSFWCGCDAEQMDRLYRASGLMRDKWERKQAGSTYGELTMQKTIDNCFAIFDPIKNLVPAEDEFEALLTDDSETDSEDDPETDSEEDVAADAREEAMLTQENKRELAVAISLGNKALKEMHPHSNPLYSWSEMGLGRLFADYYERIARFVPERKSWYVYNGCIWKHDVGGMLVMQLAKHLVNELIRYAATIERDAERADYLEFITKIQTRRKRQIMVDDAQDEYCLHMESFDKNLYLFNCLNGTLNLRTMEFHEHRPEDLLTLCSGVHYDPAATCPRWISFVNEVMCNDADLADFFQRALGYALTGDTSQECLFILYGATSRNGKTTAMECFLKMMGDYGRATNPETLGAKFGIASGGSGPSEEVARLAGARFVNVSEPEKHIVFNAALVKRLTGNNIINARYLHENSFEFKTTFKIFIDTNYLPKVSDMTLFASGRIKTIPFKRHFEDHEQDKTLKSQFAKKENMSGIFNWCVQGYKKFCANGIEPVQAVIDATAEYRKESDRISQFIEAWIEEGEAYEVRTSAVFSLYQSWCADNGYRAGNAGEFNKALAQRFTVSKRRPKDGGGATTMLMGCRLRDDEDALVPVK